MKRFLVIISSGFFVLACSSTSGGVDGGSDDAATASDSVSVGDAASETSTSRDSGGADAPGDAAADGGNCAPPQGTTCPSTSGNCKGIGTPCTKGGGQCVAVKKVCDVDLSASGAGVCISIAVCTPNTGSCGNGATCCQTPGTSNVAVCLPNQCLASDCTAEP